MKSNLYNVGVVIFVVFISGNNCQIPQSPCPGTFDYENDGYNVYGVIQLLPKAHVSYVQLRVNFTIAAQFFPEYLGQQRPEGNITNINKGLNNGASLKYRVNFPIQSPLPRLTGLTVNGKTLCTDVEVFREPNQVIISITLEHKLYTSSGFRPIPVNIPNFIQTTVKNKPPVYYNDDFDVFGPGPSQSPPTRTTVPWTYGTRPEPWLTTQTPPLVHERIKKSVEFHPTYTAPTPLQTKRTTLVTSEPNVWTPPVQKSTQYQCGLPKFFPPLILGGEDYIRGILPWLVALSKKKEYELRFICSGSLISDRHVVTAAHCLHLRDQKTEVETLVVTVGAHDLDDVTDNEAKRFYVKESTPHSGYNSFSLKNDILVLTLKNMVTFTDYIIPVCLWSEDSTDLSQIVGKKGLVAGWGGTNEIHKAGHGRPRKARIPIVSTEDCQKSHEDFLKLTSDTTICAGDRNSTIPCYIGSGGGLYLRQNGDKSWRLRGVMSVALENEDDDSEYECNIQEYVVLTDVAKFTPWIRNVMETT